MRTIAIVNQQQASGKTTSAVNLAAALAREKAATLLVDLDPAACATAALAAEPRKNVSAYHVVTAECDAADAIVETKIDSLSILPAKLELAVAEYELAGIVGAQFLLAEQLKPIANKYDYCIIDCPSELGFVTISAMVAARDVIIPIPNDKFDCDAVNRLLDIVKEVNKNFRPCGVKIRGLLHTFAENRTKAGKQAQRRIKRDYKQLLLDTVIDKTPALAEALAAAEPVIDYAPRGKSSTQYKNLAREISNAK